MSPQTKFRFYAELLAEDPTKASQFIEEHRSDHAFVAATRLHAALALGLSQGAEDARARRRVAQSN